MLRSINPKNGELVAEYAPFDAPRVAQSIERADAEHRRWRRRSYAERAAVLLEVANELVRRRDDLAVLMADEMGKPVAEGGAEIDKCAWVCRTYAEEAARFLADRAIETERVSSYVHHEPLGVILAVMPWNFPFWQVFRFAAPALMAGNAGLLKHASNVTGCALAIDAIFLAAGLPDGLFRTLVLPASRVSEVIDHPLVRAVTLTGSEAAGAAVAARAGSLLKKTVLELGGSDPYVILADADLDLAAKVCATSRLINGGQSCIAAKRFVVVNDVHDAFVERLVAEMSARRVGDPLSDDVDMGPLARLDLRNELHDQVTRSVDRGADIALGGTCPAGPGAFYPATVLTGVEPGMPASEEETFGPVAAVIRAPDEDRAIEIANDFEFGLGAAVFTRDVARGERIAAERLDAGCCFVNAFVASDPRLPFGGIKRSGYGRELSDLGIREFVNQKTVVVGS